MKVSAIAALVIAVLAVLAVAGCGSKFDGGPNDVLRERSPEVNLERVREWSLQLNGKPFANETHTVRIGEEVHVTGNVHVVPEALPPGMKAVSIRITFRPPQYSPSADWAPSSPIEAWQEWDCGISLSHEAKGQGHIERRKIVSARAFEPGEYNARVYLEIMDFEGTQNSVDLLGTAQVRFLPAAASEEDVSVSAR